MKLGPMLNRIKKTVCKNVNRFLRYSHLKNCIFRRRRANETAPTVDLVPLADQTPAGPGGDVAGKTVPHKPRRNNTTGGKPPGVSDIVKMGKNILSEFEGDNWAKSASGNVTSQALSACLAESQFKRCAA